MLCLFLVEFAVSRHGFCVFQGNGEKKKKKKKHDFNNDYDDNDVEDNDDDDGTGHAYSTMWLIHKHN